MPNTSPRHKTVFVPSIFAPVYEVHASEVPTGEYKKGLLGIGAKAVTRTERKRVEVGTSDKKIDGDALANAVEQAIQVLESQGYELLSATPVVSGEYQYSALSSSPRITRETEAIEGGGYGYGYSYTSGVLLVARRSAA
jgi:hypothetical protein